MLRAMAIPAVSGLTKGGGRSGAITCHIPRVSISTRAEARSRTGRGLPSGSEGSEVVKIRPSGDRGNVVDFGEEAHLRLGRGDVLI